MRMTCVVVAMGPLAVVALTTLNAEQGIRKAIAHVNAAARRTDKSRVRPQQST